MTAIALVLGLTDLVLPKDSQKTPSFSYGDISR